MVTSLRAFLRFAHATGRTAVPLAGAVPAVASWRLASLPHGLAAAEIERLLAGCQAHPRDGHYRPGSDAVFYSRRFSGGSLAFAFPVPA
jgi:hypothetical protein